MSANQDLARRIADICRDDAIERVVIQTHHGDDRLEIVECWVVNGELRVGVAADVPPKFP